MAIKFTGKEQPTQPARTVPIAARAAPAKPEVAIETPKVAGARGRPKSGKVVVTIRLDPDVVAKFKAACPDGKGWQSRINDVLKAARV